MITTNKDTSVEAEQWLIDARDPFEEFEAVYVLEGKKHSVTVQAQPADENGSGVRFLIVDSGGCQSHIEHDSEIKGWIDTAQGETAVAKRIGAEIEKHMQFDNSPPEDAGIHNSGSVNPAQPFTGWYKLFGKKHHIRIKPVLASPRNQYHIYDLDAEHDTGIPERILLYSSELETWVEKDRERESNHWLDREKGYSLYSWIIGHILDAVQ